MRIKLKKVDEIENYLRYSRIVRAIDWVNDGDRYLFAYFALNSLSNCARALDSR